MARIEMTNGDVFTGKDAGDLVDAIKAQSPFTRGMTRHEFMANMLLQFRSIIPNRTFDIPDEVADSPDDFVPLYLHARLAKSYVPTGSGGSTGPQIAAKAVLGGLGFVTPAEERLDARIPSSVKNWTRRDPHLVTMLPDGHEYQLTNTDEGWAVASGWYGAWTYLNADGTDHGKAGMPLERAPKMSVEAAIQAAKLHAGR